MRFLWDGLYFSWNFWSDWLNVQVDDFEIDLASLSHQPIEKIMVFFFLFQFGGSNSLNDFFTLEVPFAS